MDCFCCHSLVCVCTTFAPQAPVWLYQVIHIESPVISPLPFRGWLFFDCSSDLLGKCVHGATADETCLPLGQQQHADTSPGHQPCLLQPHLPVHVNSCATVSITMCSCFNFVILHGNTATSQLAVFPLHAQP